MATYKVTLTVTTQHPVPEMVIEEGLKYGSEVHEYSEHWWVRRPNGACMAVHSIDVKEDI